MAGFTTRDLDLCQHVLVLKSSSSPRITSQVLRSLGAVLAVAAFTPHGASAAPNPVAAENARLVDIGFGVDQAAD
jgi:hypothetical protein